MFTGLDPALTVCDFVWKCWRLEILCDDCGRRVAIPCDALKALYRPELTVRDLGRRMKCVCGSRRGRLFQYQDQPATKARDFARHEVEVARSEASAAWGRRTPVRS